MSVLAEDASGPVTLTGVRPSDSPVLFGWINDPELVRFSAPFQPVSQADHDAWFAAIDNAPTRRLFVIRETVDGPPLGVIQLIDIHPVHRSAELVIRIGSPGHRDRGIGAKAIDLVCRKGFEALGLHRIWLRVFAHNHRAIRAYEKAGFQHEGVMKDACWIEEAWTDLVVMGRLGA